jgi:REP element-mobilizing transposase RayT
MADRLHRLEWLFKRNPIYFVTANTHSRAKILATPAIHKAFQEFAAFGSDHGAWVGAYVLMPDHLHAFVALDDRKILTLCVGEVLEKMPSQKLFASLPSNPALAERLFRPRTAECESYSEKWHHVRENPVRAGLVSRWEDWPYLGEPHPLEYREL